MLMCRRVFQKASLALRRPLMYLGGSAAAAAVSAPAAEGAAFQASPSMLWVCSSSRKSSCPDRVPAG